MVDIVREVILVKVTTCSTPTKAKRAFQAYDSNVKKKKIGHRAEVVKYVASRNDVGFMGSYCMHPKYGQKGLRVSRKEGIVYDTIVSFNSTNPDSCQEAAEVFERVSGAKLRDAPSGLKKVMNKVSGPGDLWI